MSVIGVVTDLGIEKAREVQNGEGFRLFPESFSVSNVTSGAFPTIPSMVGITAENAGVYFTGPIAARTIINTNQKQTLSFSAVPDGGTFTLSFQNEATTALAFNATATDIELALEALSTVDAAIVTGDFTSGFEIDFEGVTIGIDSNFLTAGASQVAITVTTTQQKNNAVRVTLEIPPGVLGSGSGTEDIQEIYLNANDLSATPFILAVGRPTTTQLYDNQGQTTLRLTLRLKNSNFADDVVFQYTQATEISSHNTDPNAHADIRSQLEKAGIFEQVGSHEFIGQHFDELAIGPDRSFELGVITGDLVYLDTDEIYKKAVADGTIKQRVAGMAHVERGSVYVNGLVALQTGYPESTLLYLHPTNPGQVTNVPSGKPIGQSLDEFVTILRIENQSQVSEYIDTVVSLVPGFNHYPTLQEAIDAAPIGGWVRVDELEELRNTVTFGKQVNLLFTGISSGVTTFAGLNEVQEVNFSTTPDSGDFVLAHDGNKTTRIPFNATAGAVESALEALPSITSVNVTGDFSSGFQIEFDGVDGLQDQTQIAPGTDLGVNEIQRINFDNDDFASGSFRLNFDGQLTSFIAFNSINASTIESELEALSNLTSVTVTLEPSPPAGQTEFIVEFTGVDGTQDQNLIVDDSNTLQDSGSAAIAITVSADQEGELPDNLLLTGAIPVIATANTLVEGEIPGDTTAFEVDADGVQMIGLGSIEGFQTGIDLLGSAQNTRFEMYFDSNVIPVDFSGVGTADFNYHGSIGFDLVNDVIEDTTFRDLVKVEAIFPTPDKTVTISSSEILLSDGSKHGFIVDQRVSQYPGGTINFATGAVTGGGANFVPYTASMPNYFFKYAIVLTNSDEIVVIPPTGDSANANTAPVPKVEGGILRAIVTIQDDGGGGITDVLPGAITRFFDVGAFSDEFKIRQVISAGGSAIIDITTGAGDSFTFDPDNDLLDIEVFVNGVLNEQDRTGGLTKDYRKISSTQIEFADGAGNPWVVPASSKVTVKYKDNRIDSFQTGIAQVSFPSKKHVGDGVSATFDLTPEIPNVSTNDAVNDIMVYVNGNKMCMGEDFTKISATQIKFIDGNGGPDFPIPNNARIEIVGRDYAVGSGANGNTIAVKEEGVEVANPIGSMDFVGPFVTADEPTPGDARVTITAEENAGNNCPGGEPVFKGKTGHVMDFKSIKGIGEIFVTSDADTICIGLSAAPYYQVSDNTQSGILVTLPAGNFYSPGSNRLAAYRNGLRMIQSITAGQAIDRYIERGINSIEPLVPLVGFPSPNPDTMNYVHENVTVTRQILTNLTGTVINVTTYGVGTERLRMWRNGILMTKTGFGEPVDRYSETGPNQVTLAQAATATDVFLVEVMGEDPDFREDLSNFAGNTHTLSNPIDPNDDNLLVFRNGLLMINADRHPTLGAPVDRYSVISTTQVQFETLLDLDDWVAFIRKP